MKTNYFLHTVRRSLGFTTLVALAFASRSVLAQADAAKGHRYNDLIIEYLALQPQVEVNRVGDGPRRPDGDTATLTAFLYNLRDSDVYAAIDWGGAAERQEIGYLQAGESKAVSINIPVADIPYDKPIMAEVYNMEEHKLEETDRATLHGEKTMRVALLVEKRTWEAGNKQFGSFTRHMRESFESLHDLFAVTAAPPEAGLKRAPMADRFRIELVELYDRPADSMDATRRAALFDTHPKYDLVINCDESGPFTGFWPTQSTVGYNFVGVNGDSGLASKSAEQVLWKSLLESRGVQDFAMYRVPAGALPGRTNEAIDLPEPFNGDLMNGASSPLRLGALSAAIANANAGVSRLGSVTDPASSNAYMWRWLPTTLHVQIVDAKGQPMSGVKVKWFRSMPMSAGESTPGVAANRPPDGSAATDVSGQVTVKGDYLSINSDPGNRSLWLLVEAEGKDGTRRFGIVSGLWLNAAYAAGSKDAAVWSVDFDKMHAIH